MLYEKTQYLFPRVYHLNYKYITVSEGVSKSTHAMFHCSSTSPPYAAATLAFPTGEGKAPWEIQVLVLSLRVLPQLQQRWDFTWEQLQCSYLDHSCSVHPHFFVTVANTDKVSSKITMLLYTGINAHAILV